MTEEQARIRLMAMTEKALGNFGEAVWARVLAASGFGYIPLCKIETGGAPMIEGNHRIVLPDFEVLATSLNVYMESKAKTTSVLWRRQRQERHGIDRRNWREYMEAATRSNKPCVMAVVELFREQKAYSRDWSGSLLVETLRNLGPPIPGLPEYNQAHMVYWPRKGFHDLDSWSALELLDIAKGRLKAQYPIPLKVIFESVPSVQLEMFS